MTEFSDLNLCPINNRQGIVIDGEKIQGYILMQRPNLKIPVCQLQAALKESAHSSVLALSKIPF